MEIFFKTDQEVMRFCETLFQENKQIAVHWQLNRNKLNQLTIESEPLNEIAFQAVAKGLASVYLEFHFRNVLTEIIKHTYYFEERHEIENIYEHAEWIVTSEDSDSRFIRRNKNPLQLLRATFLMHLRNAEQVDFTSIVQSGMKPFKEELIDYVGLAIDEFKREEEYQAFINMLREYVTKKEPEVSTVHVVHGETFIFYDPIGREWSVHQLRALMKKTPLYLLGFPDEEWNLAPFIAMAPEKIVFYVDDPFSPKVQTVLNVFEERVTIKRREEFPYTYMLYSKSLKRSSKR